MRRRCRIAAPARAASIACSAIWAADTGSASDMVGVWIEPVMAQLIMTFSMRFTPDHRVFVYFAFSEPSSRSCQMV
jgi:hypothetical protein